MADIVDINEAWNGHSGLEVETFLKRQLAVALSASEGKFGAVQLVGTNLVFYDEENGNVLGSVSLSGQNYTINIASNVAQTFYVLADETTKMMTISPTTSVSSFGSQTTEDYPENYSYVIAVNTGNGYVNRLSGNIPIHGTASFDIRPYLATGDNYIRVTITGELSRQTRSIVYTGTLTTLTMSVNHTWQNVWNQGQAYNITGIRFAGSLVKTLHVSVNNVEQTPVEYAANQSYTTTATYYTIPASAFPATGGSGVYSVKLWMTAQGVSTPVISYNIMCVKENDNTPLVAINAITKSAVNYTSGTLFSYAVYNANRVSINMSATLNSVVYTIASGISVTDREQGVQYPFAYSLEVDTGANETKTGTFAISATAYLNDTIGGVSTASTVFDNTYSYLATPGALFYLNAATRDNGAANYQTIVNDGSPDENFAASYQAVWTGMSWYNDGWSSDPGNRKALVVPAGCTCTVTDFAPLSLLSSYDGMTIELMIQNANPSDYATPVFSMVSGGSTPLGLLIYPTKIVVWGSAERNEDYQTVNISENRITHICITFVKGYEGMSGKNLCSVYANGISNVNFAYDGSSSFGNGSLVIGQPDTDAYLYKMRVYGGALESQAVLNNFLNCIFDGVEFTRSEVNAENNVLDGDVVDYAKVKAAGFNTMVITTPNNVPIPSVYNDVTVKDCTWLFEYAGHPEWNVSVAHVPIDGQGTTSKKYFRWNLRAKTTSETVWTYGDGTSETGKEGHFIKDSTHARIDRITAKKNTASSPQGHKMGLTGLYNDLFMAVGLGSELPDPNARVAVFQFPFVGFQYNTTNGTYEFIGIYTAGPDKGSKVTFGYDKTNYPDCLSIEGPNHAPRGTRFLCPWVDVDYDYIKGETLTFGGIEGWDADYIKYDTKYNEEKSAEWNAQNKANILALYTDEWQPAYNCVYDNSPYIASYQEVINGLQNPSIQTLADLLATANAGTIKAGKTNGMIVTNEYIAFYDSSYDLYFYRNTSGKYEKLPDSYAGYKNALTDLASYLAAIGASTSEPTTAQIIEARAARFKATAPSYFDMDQTMFHYCFCILWAVTDNFAKNSYPFKFRRLTDTGAGNRWGWRQDDLDSVLMTDNNGTNTKKYSVEHLDTLDGVQVFQGGDAALWVLIKRYYEAEAKSMMERIANAADAIATRLGIQGSGLHESLFNLTSYYCWEHSSKYFPATIYEKDRRWSYIEPWLLAGQTRPGTSETYPNTYNGVAPLTQALGDQYQGESLWMERRIAYIFSKYRIGAFTGTNTGYNAIIFTLASSFTFTLTPAIDLYPVVSLVQDDEQAGRTPAGSPATVSISTTGDSNNAIHGGDWLASLGDLSRMRLTSRGGSSSIEFSIVGARLQTLKIGDETASNVLFNATVFGVTSPTLTSLDARNTTTVTNNIDLLGCPRLRTCLFEGSGAAGLLLPVGAKLTQVSFPSAATTVFMHSLPFLDESNLVLPTLSGITTLYINNCANIEPFSIAEDIIETTGEQLAYITLIWSGVTNGTVSTIKALAQRAGEVVFDGNSVSTQGGKPHVEGMVQVSWMYDDDLDDLSVISEEDYQTNLKKALSNLFNTNFYIIYDPNALYIRFADPEVERICVEHWSSDGVGLTTSDAANVASVYKQFSQNTAITSFDEFKYFTGLRIIGSNVQDYVLFAGCTNLERITLPEGLTQIKAPGTSGNYIHSAAFYNCTSLKRINIPNSLATIGSDSGHMSVFTGCTSVSRVDITDLTKYLNVTFYGTGTTPFNASTATSRGLYLNGVLIEDLVIPDGTTSIKQYAFYKNNELKSVSIPSSVTSIGTYAFYGCSGLTGDLVIPSSVTSINSNAFESCSYLRSLTIEGATTTIGQFAVHGCSRIVDITSYSTATINWTAFASATSSTGPGNGTGTLFHHGSISVSSALYNCFKKIFIAGNLNSSASYPIRVGKGTIATVLLEEMRVGGNLTNSLVTNSVNTKGKLKFIEIMGSATGTTAIITSESHIASGCIMHLGYDAYTNNAPACPASMSGISYGSLSKIYVGKGESETEDNNILSIYLADADWSAYSSKLDTWWNYCHSADANQDYVNSPFDD